MKPKILVVGDVMLDRYIHGTVERISPEAPIPILRQTHIEDRAGGAANVALNLASLGADVVLASAVVWDSSTDALQTILDRAGVPLTGTGIERADAASSVKVRYVSMGQQMLRIDQGGARPDGDDMKRLNVEVRGLLGDMRPDALVLSDYAGGVLDGDTPRLIAHAKEHGIPVYVDPKGADWTKYRGATLIKPNEIELRAMVGECDHNELLCRGAQLLRELDIDHMLVTHGASGMTLTNKIGDLIHQPAKSGPVVDVTGAGDTVLACVAYMRTLKAQELRMPWYAILNRAAAGAAAVCARHGTSVVTMADLYTSLQPEPVPA